MRETSWAVAVMAGCSVCMTSCGVGSVAIEEAPGFEALDLNPGHPYLVEMKERLEGSTAG